MRKIVYGHCLHCRGKIDSKHKYPRKHPEPRFCRQSCAAGHGVMDAHNLYRLCPTCLHFHHSSVCFPCTRKRAIQLLQNTQEGLNHGQHDVVAEHSGPRDGGRTPAEDRIVTVWGDV